MFSFRGILVILLCYRMFSGETSLKWHSTVNDNCVQDIHKIIFKMLHCSFGQVQQSVA